MRKKRISRRGAEMSREERFDMGIEGGFRQPLRKRAYGMDGAFAQREERLTRTVLPTLGRISCKRGKNGTRARAGNLPLL